MMSVQYTAPNLSVHMRLYGYNAAEIGASFAIPGLIYAASSPFIFLVTARFKKRGVILNGFLLATLAMLMIGGSDLMSFQRQPVFIFLGLIIMGFGISLISIPILPEMLEAIE